MHCFHLVPVHPAITALFNFHGTQLLLLLSACVAMLLSTLSWHIVWKTKTEALACAKHKRGKAVGLDGIAMEAFIYGGHRMYITMFTCV